MKTIKIMLLFILTLFSLSAIADMGTRGYDRNNGYNGAYTSPMQRNDFGNFNSDNNGDNGSWRDVNPYPDDQTRTVDPNDYQQNNWN